MKKTPRKLALTIPSDGDLVERAAPGAAPTAFRIWSAGANQTDDGPVFFTPLSAQLLMQEQTDRRRLYSIDFDHLSLSSDRPAESGRAAGWHSLEVRQDANAQPELWAVSVEWCASAKSGLEEQPPAWRYFSPAFFTSLDGEILSYVNLALCVNPLTHQLPSLASVLRAASISGAVTMTKAAAVAALAALANAECSPEDKKAALDSLAAFLTAESDDDDKKEDAEGDEDKEDDKPSDDEEKKEDAAKAATIKLAQQTQRLQAQIDAIEVKDLIATRPDLNEGVRTWLATQSLPTVKSFVSATPKQIERPSAPTKGESTESGFVAPALGTHPIDKVFGIRTHSAGSIGLQKGNGVMVIAHGTPAEAAAYLAKKGA